jgi:putative toxin-antitoxin system antitoxin component (TIGR02293 family)
MRATAQILQVLGDRPQAAPVRSTEDLKQWIREGFPFASLESVMTQFGLKREEVSWALDLPSRTLARRKQDRRLSPGESDRLYRVVRIAVQASEVLGGREQAERWLHTPNRALSGQMPLELLDTDLGSRQVEEILGRIEHGVFS